jgi:hypothetical protein
MRLYHRTTLAAADAILADGFRDGAGAYMTTHRHRGVWLSDSPLDFADGIPSDWTAILEIDLDAEVATPYEWIEPQGGRREFLVPASLVNAAGRPLLTVDDLNS